MGKSHDLATIADDGFSSLDVTSLSVGSGGLTVGTDQLAVDSSGRVTMADQPAFSAYADSGGNQYFSGGTVPTFSNIDVNQGGHFSGTRFTAPVAGNYRFSYCILAGSAGGFGIVALYKNGSAPVGSQTWSQMYAERTNGASLSCTQILNLTANDYVELYIHATHDHFYWDGNYSKFNGYLIG